MPHYVYVYVPSAYRNAANAAMPIVTGDNADNTTFSQSKMINGIVYYYVGIVLDNAQLNRFYQEVAQWGGAWWYLADSAQHPETRTLLRSNSLSAPLGNSWGMVASEAHIPSATLPTTVYASPNGNASNTGSEDSPFDLRTCFGAMYLGADILLLDGVHPMTHQYNLDVTNRTVKALSYRGAEIDVQERNLNIVGNSGEVVGLVFNSSSTNRTSQEIGSVGADLLGRDAQIDCDNSQLRLCVFKNMKNVGFFTASSDTELYGVQSHLNGWYAPNDPNRVWHGTSLYCQNRAPSIKTIKHCIVHDGFNQNIGLFSSTTGDNVANFVLEGNISFNSGALYTNSRASILIGADDSPAENPTIRNNHTFSRDNLGGGMQFFSGQVIDGQNGHGAINASIENNYIPNKKYGTYTAISDTGNYWGEALGNLVYLIESEYDDYNLSLAFLAIYNQALATSVQVDVSAIYANGDSVAVHNAQDYKNDIQTLTVASGLITVNMQAENRTVESPNGWQAPPKCFPEFGAFILRKQ
jgi:hypothetical protein